MKEYSKGIYVKFKPEEVDILHNRMQEAGVQNIGYLVMIRKSGIHWKKLQVLVYTDQQRLAVVSVRYWLGISITEKVHICI